VVLGIVLLGVLSLAILADGYLQAYRFARDLQSTYPKLAAVRDQLKEGKPASRHSVRAASRWVTRIQREVNHARFTFELAGGIPFLGRPVQAVRLATSAAREADRAAGDAAEVVDHLLGGPSLVHHGVIDLSRLHGQAGRVSSIRSHLRAATADVRAIPHVPFVSRVDRLKADTLQQLTSATTLTERAAIAFRLLPAFLGENGPRTYFLALQNNADQRGTGGAVLGFGLLRVNEGHLRLLQAGSINELDRKILDQRVYAIPRSVRFYLKATGGHRPRINNGLNFTANFPSAASVWARQVRNATGRDVNGVIAIDPVGVSYALQGQGSFRVPVFGQPIDASNVVSTVESGQYNLPFEQQQAVPQELVAGAFRLLLDPNDLLTMGKGIGKALSEKRIQLWFHDPKQEQLVRSLGWDGGLDAGSSDFLLLTQNKRISNKVDYYTHQEIAYSLRLAPNGDGQARTEVRLVNEIPPGQNQVVAGPWNPYGLNLSLLDLYVPKRTENVVVTPFEPLAFHYVSRGQTVTVKPTRFVEHVEGDTRVYTKHVEAWPGHPGELTYRYDIPRVAKCLPDGSLEYDLRLRHQPTARPTQASVRVELPPGSRVEQADPIWSIRGTVAGFRTTLDRDIVTSFRLRPPAPC
jgi:hypothetical protein